MLFTWLPGISSKFPSCDWLWKSHDSGIQSCSEEILSLFITTKHGEEIVSLS